MPVQNIAMRAYQDAQKLGDILNKNNKAKQFADANKQKMAKSFNDTITESLVQVNAMENQKETMIKSFASGEQQNVHELMISLQKAGVAMKMTTAVRGKLMEAYKTVMQMSV